MELRKVKNKNQETDGYGRNKRPKTEQLQESPANAKGTRDSSACMKAHCEQM